jgi:hypothetical protein
MQITPLHPSVPFRPDHRAGIGGDAIEALSAADLPDHAAPAAAAPDMDPDRRPLPPHRALVPPPAGHGRRADALLAARAYAAPTRRVSPFPAGSLLALAV